MKTKWNKSFLKEIPSGVLALIILILATIVLFVTDEVVHSFDKGGLTAYILNGLLIAVGCFFIIKREPKSIFYVPFICNALLIFSAFVEPNFWRTSMWMPICGGWALTFFVSIIGALIGSRHVSREGK